MGNLRESAARGERWRRRGVDEAIYREPAGALSRGSVDAVLFSGGRRSGAKDFPKRNLSVLGRKTKGKEEEDETVEIAAGRPI